MSNLYITTDTSSITMKDSSKVTINTEININGTEFPIKIEADFSNVPNHLHEAYFQALIKQYN